ADEPWLLGMFMPGGDEMCTMPTEICARITAGHVRGRSGDIWLIARPGWIDAAYKTGGTTHGSPYVYDTHAPFIVEGMGIPPAQRYDKMGITDIAPTLAVWLGWAVPAGATGKAAPLR